MPVCLYVAFQLQLGVHALALYVTAGQIGDCISSAFNGGQVCDQQTTCHVWKWLMKKRQKCRNFFPMDYFNFEIQ